MQVGRAGLGKVDSEELGYPNAENRSSRIGRMSKTALFLLPVQSYRQCTYSMFVVLIKTFSFTILLLVTLETKKIVVNTWTRIITVLSISKSIPGFFLIVNTIIVPPAIIVVVIIITSTEASLSSQR